MKFTFNEVIEYAKRTKKPICINYPESFVQYAQNRNEVINQYNSKTSQKFSIGIEYKPFIWFWFESFCLSTDKISFDQEITFMQRYNQLNGHVIKAFRKGFDVKNSIVNYLNN